MNIFNIRQGFATNSSSSHSILVLRDGANAHTDETEGFHWDFFTVADKETKESYLGYNVVLNLKEIGWKNKQIKKYVNELFDDEQAYSRIEKVSIDHQSVWTLPRNWDNSSLNQEFLKDVKEYLSKKEVVILGGNDNTDESHPLSSEGKISSLNELPRESSNDHLIARKEKDYWVLFNRKNGSKMRMSFVSDIAPTKAIAPELADIKITDFCPYACEFCYQDSTLNGKHAKLSDIKNIAQELSKAQVFEVACLAEGTMVLSENGYIPIEKLKENDLIFSSEGTLKAIKKITTSEKECIEIKGNKGFSVVCTPDHPFMVNNEVVEARNLLHKKLDILKQINPLKLEKTIDLSKYRKISGIHPNSRGGQIKGKEYKYSSSSKFMPCEVTINEDLMFFYGLVVAEGDKKGISLNINEIDLAHRCGNIYNSIGKGIGYKIYPNKTNGLKVEFKNPSFYESIFFKEFNCGYGAKNKNLSYLFKISDISLIRSALYGLLLGDGCFRVKQNKKNDKIYNDYCISLKTISERLALDFIALLKLNFDIHATLYRGISPDRKIENRSLKSSPYFSVEIYGKSNIKKIFPHLFSTDKDYQKIGQSIFSKNKNKDFIQIKSIEEKGKKLVYDITMEDDSSHIFTISHGVLTHNCGGGETTLHPNFVEILKLFKQNNIVPNFTTKNFNLLRQANAKEIVENCGAMAFSVQNVDEMKKVKASYLDFNARHLIAKENDYYTNDEKTPSPWKAKINFQIVMGSCDMKEFKKMLTLASEMGHRVTLLGYKENGRGTSFAPHDYSDWLNVVENVQKKSYSQISIDTALAAEFESVLKQKVDTRTFHITEGAFSAYIDAVKMEFAPSSYIGLEQAKPFDNEWIKSYETMVAKPVYKKTFKINS